MGKQTVDGLNELTANRVNHELTGDFSWFASKVVDKDQNGKFTTTEIASVLKAGTSSTAECTAITDYTSPTYALSTDMKTLVVRANESTPQSTASAVKHHCFQFTVAGQDNA